MGVCAHIYLCLYISIHLHLDLHLHMNFIISESLSYTYIENVPPMFEFPCHKIIFNWFFWGSRLFIIFDASSLRVKFLPHWSQWEFFPLISMWLTSEACSLIFPRGIKSRGGTLGKPYRRRGGSVLRAHVVPRAGEVHAGSVSGSGEGTPAVRAAM